MNGKRLSHSVAGCLLLVATACSGDDEGLASAGFGHTEANLPDVLSMSLDVKIAAQQATAQLKVATPAQQTGVLFEAGGLTVDDVRLAGEPCSWTHRADGMLSVDVEPSDEPHAIDVDYSFEVQSDGDGWLANGSTLSWPYFCGNLFPCNSDPADGLTFALQMSDVPEDAMAIYPPTISTDAPSYQLAWAIGDYQEQSLGVTDAGTEVLLWFLPGSEHQALEGAKNLRGAMDYFEKAIGPYLYGDRVGTVEANWGGGAYGGMEHHPYWHVGSSAMESPTTQVHEAAHGWFGDGIRIACWEDFVLSEGTVSYLTARAITEVGGEAEGEAVWSRYQSRLNSAMWGSSMKIAWPEGCGEIDLIEDGLFSSIPYMKGAFFYRALEKKIGVEALMQALSKFYMDNGAKAARMQDLLDTIAEVTDYDPAECAHNWLRSEELPDDKVCP